MAKIKDEKYKSQIENAWRKYEENDLSGAIKICSKIKEEFPHKPGARYLLGLIHFDKKQFIESVKELKEALENDNEKKISGFINFLIGKNYGNQTFPESDNPLYDKDSSRKYFEQALEFDDCPEDAINELHYIYQNNYKLIQLFRLAVKKFPTNLNFVITLADTYYRIGQIDNQEKVLIVAKEKFSSTHIYYELSKIELNKKNFDQAHEFLKLAYSLNENPNSEFALQLQLANIYYTETHFIKAKDTYIIAFNKEKNTDNFWFGLIGVLMCVDKSTYNEFISLISTMEITKQFIVDDWFGDMGVYFDSLKSINISLPLKEEIAIAQLDAIKKSQTDADILGKIELFKCSLYKHIGNKAYRLKSIKESIKYLNCYHYKFILFELNEAYFDMFCELVESNKNFDNLIFEIMTTLNEEYSFKQIFLEYLNLITEELHKQKKYQQIITFYEKFSKQQIDKADIWFEVGYAYNELGNLDKAKFAYHRCIDIKGETSATLNNLANIYKKENILDKAIDMYQRALSLESNDDLVKGNLERALNKQKEINNATQKNNAINKLFSNAIDLLKTENFFTLESLYTFLLNCRKEDGFDNWKLAVQDEMFPILMNTNPKKAIELKNNWISKNYIIQSEETDEYDIFYYLINPLLDEEINRLRDIVSETNLPKEWLTGLNNISIFQLNELNYSDTSKKFTKINEKYRPLITRDYNELVFNYLVGNKKSTIVLSGSFVELILTYYCERKKIKKIEYINDIGKTIKKDLYDCVLFDLISFIEEQKFFGNDFLPLTNLSRVYRNFIHPGVELKNRLDKTKSDLCFISSIEILRKIVT